MDVVLEICRFEAGDMSVSEYVAEFGAISNYGMSFIKTLLNKSEKIIMSLDDYLREKLVRYINEPFYKLVEKALRLEIMVT